MGPSCAATGSIRSRTRDGHGRGSNPIRRERSESDASASELSGDPRGGAWSERARPIVGNDASLAPGRAARRDRNTQVVLITTLTIRRRYVAPEPGHRHVIDDDSLLIDEQDHEVRAFSRDDERPVIRIANARQPFQALREGDLPDRERGPMNILDPTRIPAKRPRASPTTGAAASTSRAPSVSTLTTGAPASGDDEGGTPEEGRRTRHESESDDAEDRSEAHAGA